MIQEQRKLDKFTVSGAVFSMLYDKLRGKELSQREYAKTWNWSRGSVRHKWDELEAISSLLALKSQQPNVSPKNGLNDIKNAESQPHVSPQLYNNYNIIPITSANIKPSASNKNLNKPKKGQPKFDPISKEYKFSRRTLDRLKQFGVASPSLLKDEESTVQNGAAIFDLLHRVDGHSWEEIGRVLSWLLREDNENIQKRWFMSITKLRRTNDDGIKYFEVYQAKSRVKERENEPQAISASEDYTPSYSTPVAYDDSELDEMTPEQIELARRLAS